MTDDYYPRVWIDIYIRQIDYEFNDTIPQTPPKRLTSMKDFIRDKVDSDHTALASGGIATQAFDGFEQIPNLEETNVFHGIVYVRLMYRLVGIP